MANATIDALYAGSLRLKIPISFLNNFTFYKWCVTKVAHCKGLASELGVIMIMLILYKTSRPVSIKWTSIFL